MHPIHYRRRWFYALWTGLLVLSAVALACWERPVSRDLASLQVVVTVKGVPEGSRLQGWAGPWKAWTGEAWAGQGAFADLTLPASGPATLPLLRMPIARRRWNMGYIARGTWDLVMLKVTPPSGPPRYLALPCSQDIRVGLLRPKYRLLSSIDISWGMLGVDANPPNRIP